MGMYDGFKMPNIQFPDGRFYDCEFQTKDLQQRLDQFLITSDGRITRKSFDRGEKFYHPTNLTAKITLRGDIDVTAVMAQGRLISLDIEENEND